MKGATDVHAHFVPVDYLEGLTGPSALHVEHASDGARVLRTAESAHALPDALVDEALLLGDMRTRGLDTRVVSPPPFLFLYDLEPPDAAATAAAVNDGLLDLAARHPGVVEVAATLPMGHPEGAARELRRLADRSVAMLEIGSRTPTLELDDPSYQPLWGLAEELAIPILVHPHYIDGRYASNRYHLRNLVGNPLETTYAAARLAASGVLDRHPALRFVLSHGGGALPYVVGRLAHGGRVRGELVPERLARVADRFFYDSIVFSPDALAYLVRTVGEDRVLYGTDYPFDMADPLGPEERLTTLGRDAAARIAVATPRALLREGDRNDGGPATGRRSARV